MSDTTWNRKLIMGGVGSGGRRGQWVIEYQRSLSVRRMPSRKVWIGSATTLMTMIASSAASDEHDDVTPADPALVEPAHTLRVDEHRAEPQPGEERRRHPPPALVEDLDHRRVRADRDDQRRAGLVGEQHRDVLARAVDDELAVLLARGEAHASRFSRPGARPSRCTWWISSAPHRTAPSLERVEVADDDVGLEADVEQRVGAAVDADEHRLVLAQVGLQRLEVALVVVPAHDDHRVPALDLRAQRRQLDRLERDLRLLADVLERVLGELLELVADVGPRRLHRASMTSATSRTCPRAISELVARHHAVGLDVHDLTLGDRHHLGPDVVDERDARLDDPDRPAVRVPARDRRRRVDHRAHAGGDEALGRDPVDVGVVDHRDLAGLHPPGEVLRPLVHPGDRLDGDALRARAGRRGALIRRRPRHRPDPSSSSACRRAWSDDSTPASIRRQLRHPLLPADDLRPRDRAAVAVPLADHHLGPGTGGDLREVGDAEYLGVPSEFRQLPADRGAGLAADARRRPRRTRASAPGSDRPGSAPGSAGSGDGFEPPRAGRDRRRDPQREHRPRQLAARRDLGQRVPAVRPDSPPGARHASAPSSPGSAASTSTPSQAPGIASAASSAPDRGRDGSAAAGTRRRQLGRRHGPDGSGPPRAASSARDPSSWPCRSSSRAAASSVRDAPRRGRRRTCARGRGTAGAARAPRRAAPDPRPRRRAAASSSWATSASSACRPRRRARAPRAAAGRPSAATATPTASTTWPSTASCASRSASRSPPRRRGAAPRRRAARPPSGSASPAASISSTWYSSSEISRARVRSSPPSASSSASIVGARRGPPGTPRARRRRARPANVSRTALHRRREQALVRVLAVQVDELHAHAPRARSRSRAGRRCRRGCGRRAAPRGRARPPRRTRSSNRPSTRASAAPGRTSVDVGPLAAEQLERARPRASCPRRSRR